MAEQHEIIPARPRGIYLLPNLFTTLSLFAGFYAIVAAMKGDFEIAAIAIFISSITDSLDGRVARLTHTQTAFGAQYDSLSDMVCFGVAPAILAYTWSLNYLGKLGWLAAFIYTASVTLRLARFNTQLGKPDKRYFQGLPCPSGAAVVTAGVWSCTDFNLLGETMSVVIGVITVMMALVMVSNIRYRSFKDINFKDKVPFVAILAVVLVIVGIAYAPPQMLFIAFFSYAMSGPILTLWGLKKKRQQRRLAKQE